MKVKDLNDNKIQVASFFTTEAAILDNGYVKLEDPQSMILPQNMVPLVPRGRGLEHDGGRGASTPCRRRSPPRS